MNDGYGQAYQSMYTGSMVGSGAVVFAVWGYVISNTDSRTSMVRLNETVISTIIGESVDVITKAIAVLCAPDPRSHRKEEGGRRLIKQGEWDYFVVNFEHYHGLAKREKRKKYMADLMAKKRAKEKENANIVLTDDNCAMSSLDASSTNTKEEAGKLAVYFLEKTSASLKRKLVTSPAATAGGIRKLIQKDITPDEIKATIDWLCTVNLKREFSFQVHSGNSLYEKYDKIRGAMGTDERKRNTRRGPNI